MEVKKASKSLFLVAMNTTTILPLPSDADLQLMEQEAEELAAQLRAKKSVAVGRWDQYHQFIEKKVPQDVVPDPALAPRIVAREYGFTDWERLIAFMEEIRRPGSLVHSFEAAVEAIVNGDEQMLRQLLDVQPELARARSKRVHQATLLHYTAANGTEGHRQKTPPNIVKIADMLLKAGAEADAPLMDGGSGTTLGLAATSVHPARAGVQPELMELLLDAQALTTAKLGPRKLCRIDKWPAPISHIIFGIKNGENLGILFPTP